MEQQFYAKSEDVDQRIDSYLTSQVDTLTRSAVQKLCEDEQVLVCGKTVAKNYRLKPNDVITLTVPEPKELNIVAENIPLDIVYEDSDLLVVNKPKGMVVHPAPGNFSGTLVNALMFHCKNSLSGINGVLRPGIVHRIDKDTSGLLMVAKNDQAHLALAEQVKEHTFTRIYEAVAYGTIKEDNGTIHLPIGRHPVDRKKMCVTNKNARDATTYFTVLQRYMGFTHLSLQLETGRTHQIRVHLAYLNHPIAGDPVYGPKKVIQELNGQCLHARTLGFKHPATGEYMEFTTPLPDYFDRFLATLRGV